MAMRFKGGAWAPHAAVVMACSVVLAAICEAATAPGHPGATAATSLSKPSSNDAGDRDRRSCNCTVIDELRATVLALRADVHALKGSRDSALRSPPPPADPTASAGSLRRRAEGAWGGDGPGLCTPFGQYHRADRCVVCGGAFDDCPASGPCSEWIIRRLALPELPEGGMGPAAGSLASDDLVCVDCSGVPALEHIPCPPPGYAGVNTSVVGLFLDNTRQLDLTGAFGPGNPYPEYVGGLSLANASLQGSQLNFAGMHCQGDLSLAGATISGGIQEFAFYAAVIAGNLDLSGADVSAGIFTGAFQKADIFGDLNMAGADISAGIRGGAFNRATIGGAATFSQADISAGIGAGAFQSVRIGFGLSFADADISGGIQYAAFVQ